ncbi:MAG: helix-turn-helix transcriptional regulator [Polyangiaceae bacterium]|nr:helix-turn-helix transcriptional regulator [Polyangiaceae bacterium]
MRDWQARLAEAMDARGISGSELARRSGFTPQYINSLKTKERGGRLPHDTAKRLAAALGVTVEWLVQGSGPRERLSDVYPVYQADPDEPASGFVDRYPSRTEAIALLVSSVATEVIRALLAATPPEAGVDPGRAFWIDYARQLVRDHNRIKNDPTFSSATDARAKSKSR